jgi:hypothetical protein
VKIIMAVLERLVAMAGRMKDWLEQMEVKMEAYPEKLEAVV